MPVFSASDLHSIGLFGVVCAGKMFTQARRELVMKTITALAICISAALLAVPVARAQDYPTAPIRIIVPFAPGGAVDVVARVMAQRLSEKFKQSVYVENKPGASGNIGAGIVMAAAADGYTLMVSPSTFVVNPIVAAEPPAFDPLKDFSQVALIAKGPLLFIVNPDVAKSVQEFVTKAKADPSKYNFATGGFGSAGHMSAESFKIKAGINIPVVLYRGTAPAFSDLMSGSISGMLDPEVTSLPLARGGSVKALAISDSKRSALAPEIPTFAEAGFGNFEFYTWYGLWGPANIPSAVLAKIQEAVQEIGRSPETQNWFNSQGLEFAGAVGSAFGDFERDEQSKYRDIMTKGNIARQ
jgi:tripartite-type tricarboxylate transporter receptor subunit TctC